MQEKAPATLMSRGIEMISSGDNSWLPTELSFTKAQGSNDHIGDWCDPRGFSP
jgi:hypothetical protein